jgi:hypothetical protein
MHVKYLLSEPELEPKHHLENNIKTYHMEIEYKRSEILVKQMKVQFGKKLIVI